MEILEKGKVIDARYRCDKSPAYRIDIYMMAGSFGRICEGLDVDGLLGFGPVTSPSPVRAWMTERNPALRAYSSIYMACTLFLSWAISFPWMVESKSLA